jgi:hypothetical protein
LHRQIVQCSSRTSPVDKTQTYFRHWGSSSTLVFRKLSIDWHLHDPHLHDLMIHWHFTWSISIDCGFVRKRLIDIYFWSLPTMESHVQMNQNHQTPTKVRRTHNYSIVQCLKKCYNPWFTCPWKIVIRSSKTQQKLVSGGCVFTRKQTLW